MEISDEKLQEAAKIIAKAEVEQWKNFESYPEPALSESFQQIMQDLIHDVEKGNIEQVRARMGWQYYTKRSIVAVIVCFILTCAIMPETVMAGYQKILSIIETVFEEYTEFHIFSNAEGQHEFEPVTLHYLPVGVVESSREEYPTTLRIAYQDSAGQELLIINQIVFAEEENYLFVADTENAQIEYYTIQKNETVQMIIKGERIQFLWEHEAYFINGQTKLPMDELIRILNNIEI